MIPSSGIDQSDQDITHRRRKKSSSTNVSTYISPNLYLREDLVTLQAEFPDAVISYNPIQLAYKICSSYPGNVITRADEETSMLMRFFRLAFVNFSAFFNYPSPVLTAYCQYKSAGYPWTVGRLSQSLIAILSVRWLEVSPSAATAYSSSVLVNPDIADSDIDPTAAEFDPITAISPTENGPTFIDWKRWPLSYLDPYPQWRVLCVNPDHFVGIGYSNGAIDVINLNEEKNSQIFIQQPLLNKSDFAPIVGLSFVQDSSHLLVCRFSGEIELWHLSGKSTGFSARLVLQKTHHSSIFSSVYDQNTHLLVIGGEYVGTPSGHLTLISVDTKTISECSHLKGNTLSTPSASKLRSILLSISNRQNANLSDGFASLCLSSSGNLLSALHCSRSISVWSFPSCSLLTTIISDAVSLNAATITCKPLSPLLTPNLPVPLHLAWWRRDSSDDLLAVLKSDGALSVIDIESMENQLLSVERKEGCNKDGHSIQFSPFAALAVTTPSDSLKTELILLNCSITQLHEADKIQRSRTSAEQPSSSSSYLGSFAAALGLVGKLPPQTELTETIESVAPTFMLASIVRLAATSPQELFIHLLRSCRFSEALALTNDDLEPELVWQHQWLALFQFPVSPTTFERISSVCLLNITKRINWLLRECLHNIPLTDASWKTVDLFKMTRNILKAGLTRCSDRSVNVMFEERLFHLEVLTAIYAEECALSLADSTSRSGDENEVRNWSLELQAFRRNAIIDVALFYLHTGRYAAFGLLASHYASLLRPHLLALLSTIPATEPPAQYLRPIRFCSPESAAVPSLSKHSEVLHEDAVQRLYSRLPKDFRWANTAPDELILAQWACIRARELDSLSGLTSYASDLLEITTEIVKNGFGGKRDYRLRRRALAHLQKHSNELEQFSTILYRSAPGYGFSSTLRRKIDLDGCLVTLGRLKLVDFHQLSPQQRLELLIRVCIASPSKITASEMCSVLIRHLLPFVTAGANKKASSVKVRQCLLRMAGYADTGLEAISILVRYWCNSEDAVLASIGDIDFKSCIVDFLTKFTPPFEDSELYLTLAQNILTSLGVESEQARRLSDCCAALLDFQSLVREMGYLSLPHGLPSSLGEALALEQGNESCLRELVNQWIQVPLNAHREVMGKRTHDQDRGRGVGSITPATLQVPINAVKRLYNYNRLHSSVTPASSDSTASLSEVSEAENEALVSLFDRLCGALTRLLGADSNEKARYHLLVGVLCSRNRQFIEFAHSQLMRHASEDSTWVSALRFAIGVYFDATATFGAGEVNEELGSLCLSFLPSEDSPEFIFYGAMKFLSGVNRLIGDFCPFPSRSSWANSDRTFKVKLFTSALQRLQTTAYVDAVDLIQAGKYFGLIAIEVKRCYLKAAVTSDMRSISAAANDRILAFMQEILTIPEASAWKEIWMWCSAAPEVLDSLFSGVDSSVVERFRLTLARFVVTHSVYEATCSEYAEICDQLAQVVAVQKIPPEDSNRFSVTQRFLGAFSSTPAKIIKQSTPISPCVFYVSPLDPTELPFYSCSSVSELMAAFLKGRSNDLAFDKIDIQEAWLRDCITAESLDVGLSYAYGPPLGHRPRNWTKLLCTRLSELIQNNLGGWVEEYRLLAASVSVSPMPKKPFPSSDTLIDSLDRLSEKHPCVAEWRSRAIVTRLVNDPQKFFSDAAYRQKALLTISQTRPEISLLLAKHMAESRSQLVLSNLSDIVFCGAEVETETTKQRLKELSPYLKRDVSEDELVAYVAELIDPNIEKIPLWRLLLLLKVFHIVQGRSAEALSIRGVSITKHIEFLRLVSHLETAVYLAFIRGLYTEKGENFLACVRQHLTSKSNVEALVSLMHHCDSSLGVTDAQVYSTYATGLLSETDSPVESCIDCLEAMVAPSGDADVLATWIASHLFGNDALVARIDLNGRLQLVDAAVDVASNRAQDKRSLGKLKRLQDDLHRRAAWVREFPTHLSPSLQRSLLLHHFEDTTGAQRLLVQAAREIIIPTNDTSLKFSQLLSMFIHEIEQIASLLYLDFVEVLTDASCECLNEFLTTNDLDWVYLDPSSVSDLHACDHAITEFIKQKPIDRQQLMVSLLLSYPTPRQVFGVALLGAAPTEKHLLVAQNALDHVLTCYGLPPESLENAISKLTGHIEGRDDSVKVVESLLGDDGPSNAGVIQAVGVAVELASLVVDTRGDLDRNAVNEQETNLWLDWLKYFSQHPLLPTFSHQLISRIHLARNPSPNYIAAVKKFATDDLRLLGTLQSALLLQSPILWSSMDDEVKLDPIACRRFLSSQAMWKSAAFTTSMLEAVLRVAANPRYSAFLKHVLHSMVAAGDCWLEVALLGRSTLGEQVNTMKEVLCGVLKLLAKDSLSA
uniref:Nbas_N domain-containing protein n=1 Tax=Mesocestoides corti TaxID=53468 RepID=A0A5K3EMV3_MESCO